MSNVDYVIVGAGPSLDDVLEAAKTAISATAVVDGKALITGDERTAVKLYESAGEGVVADVYYGGDLAERRVISRRIYDYIVERTDWDVTLDSDDADDVIVSRIRARA